MDVQYSPKFDTDRLELLRPLSARLAQILGPKYGQAIKAEWEPAHDDRGCEAFRLILSDWAGRVSNDFTPEQLANPLSVQVGFSLLWDDLLKVRYDKVHQETERLLDELVTD